MSVTLTVSEQEAELLLALREYDLDVIDMAVSMGAAPPKSPEAAAFRKRMDTENANAEAHEEA